jgi:threonine/homoserine/homoserine lactone efflux protein
MFSDLFFIFIAYFGSNFILLLTEHRFWAGIGSAILLAGFGIALLVKKNDIPMEAITLQDKLTAPYIYILKGFMINAMNPTVLFFWIGVAGSVSVKEHYTVQHLVVFYSSIILTIFGTDLLKAYVAHRIKKFLTSKVLLLLNRICGFALIGFAVYTLVRALMQAMQ